MFTDLPGNLAIIKEYPNYAIDINGNIYRTADGTAVEPVSRDTIVLDHAIRKIDTLLVLAYIGNMDASIVPISEYERRLFLHKDLSRQRSLTYLIESSRSGKGGRRFINNMEFAVVPNTNNAFYVSRTGIVFNAAANIFCHKFWVNNEPRVYIEVNSARYNALVARLVYMAWVDSSITASDYVMMYNDDCRYNTDLDNLDAKKVEGTAGRLHKNYDMDKTKRIVQLMAEGKAPVEIAALEGIPFDTKEERHRLQSYISRLYRDPKFCASAKEGIDLNGYNPNANRPGRVLTDQDRLDAIEALKAGISMSALSRRYGCSLTTIQKLKQRYLSDT